MATGTQFTRRIHIAVMGVTGSGKSSFIKTASGSDAVVVGDSLEGCTQTAKSYPFVIGDTIAHLIDTPGFDDTLRTDTDVLSEVSTFFATHYKLGGRLSGIIYLHPISENRIRGTARLNLDMFQGFCASTMWNMVPAEVGSERETELIQRTDFWGNMILHGSRIERHDRTKESALRIIRSLIDNEPAALDIQVQVVDEHRNLDSTTAGSTLKREFSARKLEYEKKIEELKNNHDTQASVAEARQAQLTDQIQQIEQARNKLKEDMEKKLLTKEEELVKKQQEIARKQEEARQRIAAEQAATRKAESQAKAWKLGVMIAAGVAVIAITGGVAASVAAPALEAETTAVTAAEVGFLGEVLAVAADMTAAEFIGGLAAEAAVGLTVNEIGMAALPLLALL